MKTPQAVIKNFMAAMTNHNYSSSDSVGTQILDSAVQASSKYGGIQEVIDAMKADQIKAEQEAVEEVLGSDYAGKLISEVDSSILSTDAKQHAGAKAVGNAFLSGVNPLASINVEGVIKERKAYIFLEKYCNVLLPRRYYVRANGSRGYYNDGVVDSEGNKLNYTGNDDTGAITGADANITLKVGDVVNDKTLTAADLQTLAKQDGTSLSGDTLIIGTGTEKTDRSVVPEAFVNTYVASTSAAQVINTGSRDWVVQATAYNDTVNSDGADSVNSGAGNDQININANGATVTSGSGSDNISISAQVKDVTITDLNYSDAITISGTFEVGSAQIEDTLLVITDKTGTRKIRLGDLDTAKNGKVNGTTIANWLSNAGIDINNLKQTSYVKENNIVSYSGQSGLNVANVDNSSGEDGGGRTAIDPDYTPSPVVEKKPVVKQNEEYNAPSSNSNTGNTNTIVTVNLDNVDTSTAGDVSVGGAKVGAVSSTYPNASTFTRNGLTIHLLGEITDSAVQENISEGKDSYNPSKITLRTFDELTTDQKTLIAALFKWWGKECLNLNEESYDIGFNSDTASVKDIGLYFYDDKGHDNILAAVWHWWDGNGIATKLMLSINLNYYNNIDVTDVDGTSTNGGLLDRTLAHEFTHADMAANIVHFNRLPKFIKEGMAELTHGIDDERTGTIFDIAYKDDWLDASLDLNNTGTGSQNVGDGYAGGFMFLRYFARNAALQSLFDVTELTFTEGPDNINNTVPAVLINALGGNDYIVNDGADVSIKAGDGDNTVVNRGDGASINAGNGNNLVTNNGADSVEIFGGWGDNTINVINSEDVTISSGGKISLTSSKNCRVNPGTRNATVYGFQLTDTLAIFNPSKGRETVGTDLVVNDIVSNVTLVGCASIPAELLNITDNIGHGTEVEIVKYHRTIESFDSSILISGDTDTLVKLDSIVSHGDNVTIAAGEAEDTVEVYGNWNSVSGGADEDLIILDSENSTGTLNGDDGDDKIIIRNGRGVLVDGGLDNDKITAGGQGYDTIFGGAGADSIVSNANRVTIDGGADSDTVKSFGSYASIDAADADKIYLLGGSNSTINCSVGDNFVYNDKDSSQNTFVITGSGNQTISGLTHSSTLIFGNGSDTYSKETLSNSNLLFTTNESSVTVIYSSSDFRVLGTEEVEDPEWYINGNMASYGTSKKIYFNLYGLNPNVKLSDLAFNKNSNVITLSSGALGQGKVDLLAEGDSPYKLALADDVKRIESVPAGFILNGTTATYLDDSGATEGYILSNDAQSIQFCAAVDGENLFRVFGVTSVEGLSLNGKCVTISKKSLGTSEVTISDDFTLGYTLALADDVSLPATVAASYDADTQTYKTKGTTEGYTLSGDGKTISYTTGTSLEFKFSGIADTATTKGFYVNASKKTIAIGAVSAKTDGTPVKLLSAPEGYKLELGSSLPKPVTLSANTYDAKTMTYKTKGTTGSYKLSSDGKTISYSAGTSKEFKFSGIADTATTKGFYVNASKKTIAIGAVSAKTDGTPVKLLSAPAGYKMELGSSLPKPVTISANTYDAKTMTYKTKGTTGSYALSSDGKTISYTTGTSKEFKFSGIADTATTKGFYVSTSKKTIAIGAVSTKTDGTPVKLLSAPEGYKMELGSSLPKPVTISANTYDAKTMTYKTKGTAGSYKLSSDGKTISYTAGTSKEFTFSGIADTATTKGFYVSTSKKTIAIGAVAAKTDGTPVKLLSAPAGYKMELGSSLPKAATVGTAKLEDGFYAVAGQAAGYTLSSDGKTIAYNKALDNALELSGVAAEPTAPTNGVMTLKPANFDKSLSVVSNDGDYVFSIAKGTYTGKTFIGSAKADTITNAGTNLIINAGKGDDEISNSGAGVKINAGAGNDYVKNSGANVTLNGGAGNDTLWGSDYADTFIYNSGDGNDVIGGFDDNDLLQITGTFTTAYDSAAGTIKFTVGTGSITLQDYSTTTFNVNGDAYQIIGKTLVKQ